MLSKFRTQNYRCLRSVEVRLRPLTVLIGPNDSGKTTFLRAVEQMATRLSHFSLRDAWRNESNSDVSLWAKAEDTVRSIEGRPGDPCRENIEGAFIQKVSPIHRFELPMNGIWMECAGYNGDEERSLELEPNGNRVPALLDYLLRRDRKRFDLVVDALRQYIPGLDDIAIATPQPQSRRVDLVIENGLRIPASEASVGVRLMIFFVALAYHPDPPKVILLEEPENGMHPKRLAEVMRLLRDITQGRYGNHAAQVILTTHSPYLLDCVNVDEDQVLVFKRNEDGSRDAQPVDAERLKIFLDEFMLGEVWFNEEEAGLVAKTS